MLIALLDTSLLTVPKLPPEIPSPAYSVLISTNSNTLLSKLTTPLKLF